MNTKIVDEPEIGVLLETHHNPPRIPSRETFQKEIKSLYGTLVNRLSEFGEEGDHYGESDFSIRPDLRERATFSPPPAPLTREFVITVLSRSFWNNAFIKSIVHFLREDAPDYRILVFQDFDPEWYIFLLLVEHQVFLHCTDDAIEDHIQKLCARL